MISQADILQAKILVVDDKQANVELVKGVLRIAGYTAVSSSSEPSEVCALHKEQRYDLILLDLNMPGMDGFEVMESLKTIEEGGYLPVLVITAQPDHKQRALEAGAKDFVSKPFDLAELRARVHNILEVRLLHVEAKKHNKVLGETLRELETSREREMAQAHETQNSLLPHGMPQFENFRIHAFNHPTQQLRGNFYEFLRLNEQEWMGVLADVSGNGMPAALFSSLVLGALSMEFRSGKELHKVLAEVNQLLCEKSVASQFVTLFLFKLGPDGQGEFISAGHTPAYLYRAATGKVEELAADAYMLGMFEFATYRPRKFHLDTGDILILYTDGLTKAENKLNEVFGEERLREVIEQNASLGGGAMERQLLGAMQEFTAGKVQEDDITFVLVEKTS